MRTWQIFRSRLRSVVARARAESELHEALQLHLEHDIERLRASGVSREDARLQAIRLFGRCSGSIGRSEWTLRSTIAYSSLVSHYR